MDFNRYCKQCRYYQFHLSDGILCGLTKTKPDFEDVCIHFVNDEEKVLSLKQKSDKQKGDIQSQLRGELRKWGVGLVILGLLHLILTRFLDPVWGFLIILLGVINLTSKSTGILLLNGISLLFVGMMNIFNSIAEGFDYWIFFGIMQLVWGIQEIKKYNDYKKQLSGISDNSSDSNIRYSDSVKSEELKHTGLGIASIVCALAAFVLAIIFIINAAMGQFQKDTVEDVSVTESIMGMIFFLIPLLSLTGIGLGIAGLIEKNKKRVFAVIGIILSVLQILILAILIVIGLFAGG